MSKLESVELLSFDCYGTLIDWETGILNALKPVLSRYNINIPDERILELYAGFEALAEKGSYRKYFLVLREVSRKIYEELGIDASFDDLHKLEESIKNWQSFPDSSEAHF